MTKRAVWGAQEEEAQQQLEEAEEARAAETAQHTAGIADQPGSETANAAQRQQEAAQNFSQVQILCGDAWLRPESSAPCLLLLRSRKTCVGSMLERSQLASGMMLGSNGDSEEDYKLPRV